MAAVEIDVERYRENPWSWFYEINDVTNLGPGEEKGRAWAARVDGDMVGMAVAEDTFGSTFIIRIAVEQEWRRQGVATALIKGLQDEYDDLYCFIDRDNLPSMELVADLGFERGGWSPGNNLYRWSWEG